MPRLIQRIRERQARRIELTLKAAEKLGVIDEGDEDAVKVRQALLRYRAGEIDWEEFFQILIEYLPQILAIFMAFFGGL